MLVKTIKSENGTLNIHDDYIPKTKEEYKANLTNVYDCLNTIARDLESKNIDTSYLFYTKEELEQVQNFI